MNNLFTYRLGDVKVGRWFCFADDGYPRGAFRVIAVVRAGIDQDEMVALEWSTGKATPVERWRLANVFLLED
jgi:hypothetical protein